MHVLFQSGYFPARQFHIYIEIVDAYKYLFSIFRHEGLGLLPVCDEGFGLAVWLGLVFRFT